MQRVWKLSLLFVLLCAVVLVQPARNLFSGNQSNAEVEIGREVSIAKHLNDGEEFEISVRELIAYGEKLFKANWTVQEGGGRPLTKGTGQPLSDLNAPLVFPRNFNRISGPDSNSCAGCHNAPFGVAGGSGDFVTSVFVLGQRFDFTTFDGSDLIPTRGARDELGNEVTQQTISNRRATIGMFGSGYTEMLARQMTADLQALRDATPPGGSTPLVTKGLSFGTLGRDAEGDWITGAVEGLPELSLESDDADDPPELLIRPFHQAGAVVSLRQFTINAFNQHHGIQAAERFGEDLDPDGDGYVNEMTRADMTASSIHQATLAVPGRVIPRNATIEQAVLTGELKFTEIGCAECHVPSLPLTDGGWVFSEPNPYNPLGNLQVTEVDPLLVDLTSDELPQPRLKPAADGVVYVPEYSDFKLHNITSDDDADPNVEPLDMQEPAGSTEFFAGNRMFLTARLWGAANQPPYFHHGQFTTMREAILAHSSEALAARENFEALDKYEQDSIIEFLKTLQILPPGTEHRIVDENFNPRSWTSPESATLVGEGHLQARSEHAGIKVSVGSHTATTAEGGGFVVGNLPAGVYTVRADRSQYLPAEMPDVSLGAGSVTTLPNVELKAGDITGDNVVNVLDLAVIGASYDAPSGGDPRADLNADGTCDLTDLVLAGVNYGLIGPTAWSEDVTALTAAPASEAMLQVSPALQTLAQEPGVAAVDVRIQQAAEIYGVDLELAFDPTQVEILDGDAALDGVQMVPAPDAETRYVVKATVDNQEGRARLAFTLLRPAAPLSGDALLAQIQFKSKTAEAKATGSDPSVKVLNARLIDRFGREVPIKEQ